MPFDFIYGDDEYLTDQAARERWAALCEGVDPEFGAEVIDGRCIRVEEVEDLVNRLRASTQSMGLFGGARAVWVRGVGFITDSVVGRAEGTAAALEDAKPILQNANPSEVRILVSATPIDKRLTAFKWFAGNSTAKEIKSLDGMDAAGLQTLGKEKGLQFDDESAELFLKKVGTGARAVESELEKLSVYLNAVPPPPPSQAGDNSQGLRPLPGKGPSPAPLDPGSKRVTENRPESHRDGSEVAPPFKVASPGELVPVPEELVLQLTSTVAEGEFFEPLEAFYSRKPGWALEAVRTYFSKKDNDARPILAAFFNRNRLLLMIKAAEAEGLAKVGYKGLSWTPRADALREKMGAEKSPFNLFGQNPWYLGKLAQEAAKFTLPELQAIQTDLINTFEKIHRMDEATAMEGLFVKYVAGKKS